MKLTLSIFISHENLSHYKSIAILRIGEIQKLNNDESIEIFKDIKKYNDLLNSIRKLKWDDIQNNFLNNL